MMKPLTITYQITTKQISSLVRTEKDGRVRHGQIQAVVPAGFVKQIINGHTCLARSVQLQATVTNGMKISINVL